MTRKHKLYERAWRYGTKLARLAVFGIEVGQVAYEAGYRAAMKDARKIRAEAAKPGIRDDALFDYAIAMREWLKPLR